MGYTPSWEHSSQHRLDYTGEWKAWASRKVTANQRKMSAEAHERNSQKAKDIHAGEEEDQMMGWVAQMSTLN